MFIAIREVDYCRWRLAYPGVDVDVEINKMNEWLEANPRHIKKNWKRFVVNWLNRAHRELLAVELREKMRTAQRRKDAMVALVGKGPEGKMQTKYDTLMQALRAGTAEPTKENLMRARNIVRSEFAFNSNERQLASEWLAKNSEAKTA